MFGRGNLECFRLREGITKREFARRLNTSEDAIHYSLSGRTIGRKGDGGADRGVSSDQTYGCLGISKSPEAVFESLKIRRSPGWSSPASARNMNYLNLTTPEPFRL
jgi:hypothetical protein